MTPHERHVAAGFCASIAGTKAWCNLKAGHAGNHMAPYLHPDGSTTPTFWEHDDQFPGRI